MQYQFCRQHISDFLPIIFPCIYPITCIQHTLRSKVLPFINTSILSANIKSSISALNIFFMALFPITAVISRALSFRVHDINSGIHGCRRKNMTCNMHVRICILHSFMLSSYLNSQNLAYKPVQTGT